jgi:hypothetical protein
MKLFYTGCVLILSLGVMLGCASTNPKGTEGSLKNSKKIVIKPVRSYEECVELLPNQGIKYSFQSSKDLDFNIHYHGDDKVHYPVLKKEVRSYRGVLYCDEQDFYVAGQDFFCLMWKNQNTSKARLTLEFEVIDR